MPQFILEGATAPEFAKLPAFVQGYIEAVFFTEEGQLNEEATGNQRDDAALGFNDLAPETLQTMMADCATFMSSLAWLHVIAENAQCNRGNGQYSRDTQAGHDFWLTRNGHCAGFWDGDWEEPFASELDARAKEMGECLLYVGDDQLIYSN